MNVIDKENRYNELCSKSKVVALNTQEYKERKDISIWFSRNEYIACMQHGEYVFRKRDELEGVA